MPNNELTTDPTLVTVIQEMRDCDFDIYYRGVVTDGDTRVITVTGKYQFTTVRRAKRAIKLYRKHGIQLFV